MSTTIAVTKDVATLINILTVEPENQQKRRVLRSAHAQRPNHPGPICLVGHHSELIPC
jgi:hypothetical protein